MVWPRLKNKKTPYGIIAILTAVVAAATWIHCAWFLFAVPVASFFFAREWRAGFRVSAAVIIGIAIGVTLTGHPILFLKQVIFQTFFLIGLGANSSARILVSEQQPATGDFPIVIVMALALIWRTLRGAWDRKSLENPVFMLLASSWVLGFFTIRAWLDLGIPAVTLCLALEFQDFLETRMGYLSWKRVALTVISMYILYSAVTNDSNSRWSNCHPRGYLLADNPEHAPWLPEPGGILYSDDMDMFYTTFYKNPSAPWRYMLGDSPMFMPKEDFEIYSNILRTHGPRNSFAPWVKKMKPQDRLILFNPPDKKPDIPELEWHNIPDIVWSGRLPKNQKNVLDKK
jgi:hypothetical protein